MWVRFSPLTQKVNYIKIKNMITIDNEKGYDIVKTVTLNWIAKYKYADKREGFYTYNLRIK